MYYVYAFLIIALYKFECKIKCILWGTSVAPHFWFILALQIICHIWSDMAPVSSSVAFWPIPLHILHLW